MTVLAHHHFAAMEQFGQFLSEADIETGRSQHRIYEHTP